MKISVIGAGQVGASTAQWIAQKELSNEVILFDVIEGMPIGKALDLAQSSPVEGFDVKIVGTNSYDDIKGSDVVVVTAGLPRKPGMSRDDLLTMNADIVESVSQEIAKNAPDSIVIVVSNPLDVMTYVALKVTGFEPRKVMGQSGILDTARFRLFIAEELDVSVKDVTACVLGGHGDSMVPLPRYSTVAGIPLPELMSQPTIDRLVQRTRDGGAEIVNYLKAGSAYYAPSSATVQMVEAIVKNKKRILPCAAWLTGEYGLNDVYVGVPVKLGKNGVEEIIEIGLTKEEKEALHKSAGAVKTNMGKLDV